MKEKWKKQISILLCLFLACTNLYVGNVTQVYAQNEQPYEEVYHFDDYNTADTEYEGKEYCQIEYSDGWVGEDQNNNGSAGCYNHTDHYTLTAGSTCTITFVGTNLKYYTRTNNDFKTADFSLDGSEPENVNFYSSAKTESVLLYDTGLLEFGTHVLTITANGLVVVDMVEVSCSYPYAVVNDADEGTEPLQVNYGGTWHYEGLTQPQGCTHAYDVKEKNASYKKDVHWTEKAGDFLELKFNGTYAKYYTESGSGQVKVFIDGNQVVDNLSLNTGIASQGLAFDSRKYVSLTPGLHTMKVELISGVLVADRMEVCCSHEGEGTVLKGEKAATCTEDGYSGDTYYQYCGQKISDGEVIAANGHSWDAGVVTKPPTETEKGEKTLTCTVCKETMVIEIEDGCMHENTEPRNQAATCTEAGYSGALYCNDCQKMISGGMEIPALGHEWEVRNAKEASADEDGYTGDTCCKRCDEVKEKGEVIPRACAVVNNAVTGTENLQFHFTDGWTYEKAASSADCYEGDNHWSKTVDAAFEFKFTGTSVKYFGQKAMNLGYAAFSIDGGDEEEINMYQAKTENQVLIYQSQDLQPGTHTLKVRVTGKNGGGSDFVVVADRIEVYCNHKGEDTESRDMPATCTEAARTGERYGKLCGQKISDGVKNGEPLGHEEQAKEDKAATCTEAGYMGQTYCTRCEEIIKQGQEIPALGHTEKVRGAKAATCTEAGSSGETYCEVCEAVLAEREVIPALGHSEETRDVAATCTESGYTGQTYCTRCEEVTSQGEEISKLGHQWDEGVVTKQPTDSETGIKTFTCTREGCGETMTLTLPTTSSGDACMHEHTEVKSKEATCTEDGYAGALYCNDCQKTVSEGDVITALGHNPEIRNHKEASSTEDGYTGDTYCKRCEEFLESGKAIPKAYATVNDAVTGNGNLEFDFSQGWTYEKAETSVGCYEDDNHWSDTQGAVLSFKFNGTSVKYYAQKAANLGYAAFSVDDGEEEEISLYQAEKENHVLLYESGQLEPGLHTLKVRVTGKMGEGNGNVVVADCIEVYCNHEGEEVTERSTATCTEAGSIEIYGVKCGQKISQGESAAALGHDEKIRGEEAASCEQAGNTGEKYCARCNEVLESGKVIPALGHHWNQGIITKQPTAGETGIKTFTCTVCSKTRMETLAKLPVSGTPEKGNVVKDTASGAEYQVMAVGTANGKVTGTVSYVKPSDKSAKTVKIPAEVTVNGVTFTVTSVADKALYGNSKVTKVIIGNNVTTIGANAFSGCKRLKTVSIGKNVTVIGANAFSKCTSLTKITIPAKVRKIGKQSFYGCKKLKTITVKTTKLKKSSVGSKAFKGTHAKATFKVPKSKLKSYQSVFKARGMGKRAKMKKI